MKSLRDIRALIEDQHDHMILQPEEIDLLVESYVYRTERLGYNPEDIMSEAEILQKTLTRSALYNFKHCHLRVVE